MQIVPLQPVANQRLEVTLNNQPCTIEITQYNYGLFLTLSVSGTLVLAGCICLNLVRIVRDAYLGFSGDCLFVDTQGNSNPIFGGLGSRFQLVYLEPSDLAG
jgi:hypothetical protein